MIYCDPPYLLSTRAGSGQYAHEMTDEQHEQLLQLLLKHKVIIHHLIAEGTRDDDLAESLAQKDKAQEYVMRSLKARIDRIKNGG